MEFTKDIQFNTNPTVSEDLTITYSGFLGNSQELYIVYGYGDNWEYTTEAKMEKTENGFVGTINLLDYEKINFCFKNSNNEWDNNSYCNYIAEISPEVENSPNFDIDSLIEELLFEPIVTDELNDDVDENLDLAYQLSSLIEESEDNNINNELEEYSTLDEILTATKIEEDVSNIQNIEQQEEQQDVQQNEETSLVTQSDSFIVSSRQLGSFYLLKKKIKLVLYKAFVKLPKMIFGIKDAEEQQ